MNTKNSRPQRHRNRPVVAIVGGGIGGLLTANHLANTPIEAVVFEASDTLGGRARSSLLDGAAVNLGPHALYLAGALAETLREWNLLPDGGEVAEGFGLLGVESAPLPTGVWPLATTDLLPGFARASFLRTAWAVTHCDVERYHQISARTWLDRHVQNAHVQRLMQALTRLSSYVADLDRLPAEIMLSQLKLAFGGVRYVNGGWQTIVDQLARRAQRAGIDTHTSTAVRAVTFNDTGAVITTDEGQVAVDAVVLACSPRSISRLLNGVGDVVPDQTPVEATCLDLVLSSWSNQDKAVSIGIDRPIYVSNHSKFARFDDGGRQVVHAAKYLSADNDESPRRAREDIGGALDQVEPEWRQRVVEERFLPKMTVVQHLPAATNGGRASRPTVDALPLQSVFVVGDWVGPKGWLADAVAASARDASERVMTEIRSQIHVA